MVNFFDQLTSFQRDCKSVQICEEGKMNCEEIKLISDDEYERDNNRDFKLLGSTEGTTVISNLNASGKEIDRVAYNSDKITKILCNYDRELLE